MGMHTRTHYQPITNTVSPSKCDNLEARSHEVANDADHRFDFAGSADTINEPVIELRYLCQLLSTC